MVLVCTPVVAVRIIHTFTVSVGKIYSLQNRRYALSIISVIKNYLAKQKNLDLIIPTSPKRAPVLIAVSTGAKRSPRLSMLTKLAEFVP